MANTRAGVIRRDGSHVHRLECAECGQWVVLSDEQWHGRAPVLHKTNWCTGFSLTRNFFAIVEATGGFRAV